MIPASSPEARLPEGSGGGSVLSLVRETLDRGKAESVVVLPLEGRSGLADYMLVASGRSSRHVCALADAVYAGLGAMGRAFRPAVEGRNGGNWVVLDCGDVVVHIFRPEVRAYYCLERLWGGETPPPPAGWERGCDMAAPQDL